jgi:hypothetical protein
VLVTPRAERDIGVRNWLVICCVVTEDSPGRMRGYGPFPEGAEPTAPIPAQPTGAEQEAYLGPAPDDGAPSHSASGRAAPESGAAVNQVGSDPSQNANVPSSAQNGETLAAAAGVYPGHVQASNRDAGDQSGYSPGSDPYQAGPGGPTPDPDATAAYPPQPTTPYPVTPTGMNPHLADPSGMNPHATNPTSGRPSATPTSETATSAAPASGYPSYGPFRNENPQDQYDFTSFSGRRIEPSPPPQRSRLLKGLLAGLIAGLLVFGVGGFFTGRLTAPDGGAKPKANPTAGSPAGKLGVFEQSQAALNQPHFAGTGLVAISQSWLPYLSSCSRSGEPGGPVLNAGGNTGEKIRVRCTLSGMSAIFVEYNSIADRDKARVKTLDQNVDARTLTPGVGPAVQGPTPSGRTNGNYVEYAYKLTEGGVTRPVAALWWDDSQTPVAGYLLAYWKEGLGESWDPIRDLWSRYA